MSASLAPKSPLSKMHNLRPAASLVAAPRRHMLQTHTCDPTVHSSHLGTSIPTGPNDVRLIEARWNVPFSLVKSVHLAWVEQAWIFQPYKPARVVGLSSTLAPLRFTTDEGSTVIMKTTLLACIFSTAVFLFLALAQVGVAYEDPEAVEARRVQTQRLNFRQEYREAYPLNLVRYPEPRESILLDRYPRAISGPAAEIMDHGMEFSPNRMSQKLGRINNEARRLLLSSLHPEMVQHQSQAIRQRHLYIFTALAAWTSEHIEQLADRIGQRTANAHLGFFRRVRDLAQVGVPIPTTFIGPIDILRHAPPA